MHDEQRGKSGRLSREKQTLEAMLEIYCRDHHAPESSLCPECQALSEYALARLDRCPFGAEKTTCARCPIHCYKPAMRDQVKVVMRYSGPRMLLHHPILALLHLLNGQRRPSAKARTRRTDATTSAWL